MSVVIDREERLYPCRCLARQELEDVHFTSTSTHDETLRLITDLICVIESRGSSFAPRSGGCQERVEPRHLPALHCSMAANRDDEDYEPQAAAP